MEELLFAGDTVAFVLIKAELGRAKDVAMEVSKIAGVRWAVVVTGPYDVMAAVRVGNIRTLTDIVVDGIHKTDGVLNPTTLVVADVWKIGLREDNDIP